MSGQATGWVLRHSPFKGTAFAIHFVIADTANEKYCYRFWMLQGNLAAKARCTRQTANQVLAMMTESGYLKVLGRRGNAVEYEFLMPPDVPVVYDGGASDLDSVAPMVSANPTEVSPEPTTNTHPEVSPEPTEVSGFPTEVSANPTPGVGKSDTERKRTQEELKEAPSTPVDKKLAPTDPAYGFEKFWKAYPRRNGKRLGKADTLKAWLRLAGGYDTRRDVFEATRRYAAACADGATLAKDPKRFLQGDCWRDWLADDYEAPQANGLRSVPPVDNSWMNQTDYSLLNGGAA